MFWPHARYTGRGSEGAARARCRIGKPGRAGDRPLQLSVLNEEFLVGAGHQPAPTMSLPFVHTARRYYRLSVLMRRAERPCGCEARRIGTFRGSKSRNKVSVGEPAEGSLTDDVNTCERAWRLRAVRTKQLLTMDLWALVTMKNAVKCDNWCELHYFVNHRVFERSL